MTGLPRQRNDSGVGNVVFYLASCDSESGPVEPGGVCGTAVVESSLQVTIFCQEGILACQDAV